MPCRAAPDDTADLAHLVLHEKLGAGGNGVVMRATFWGIACAVKLFDYPEGALSDGGEGAEAQQREDERANELEQEGLLLMDQPVKPKK